MNNRKEVTTTIIEHVLPWVVLAILLVYTYAKFFQNPYLGFRTDARGNIVFVFAHAGTESALRVGDRILQVDSKSWDYYLEDLRNVIFERVPAGETVWLRVERNGQRFTVPWISPGPTFPEILELAISELWLAFVFWGVGTLMLLNLRPKDIRWRLLIAFNYLTAIWLVAGNVSRYHIWEGAILLRMAIWLCVPVYLHLHWEFPRPLGKLPAPVLWTVYLAAGVLAVAQFFQAMPPGLYFMGFLLATGGSLILVIVHAGFQPATRRDLRLLLMVALVAFIPAIALGIIGGILGDPSGSPPALVGGGAILGLPLLPLAHFYAAYRRQLGNLELRINRLVSAYIFLTLLGVALFIPVVFLAVRFSSSEATIILAITASIFAAVMVLWVYPSFQIFLDRRLLGIKLPTKNLQELYSAQITTSTSLSKLLQSLRDEILPSLLIRQFVFLQSDRGSYKVLLATGVDDGQAYNRQELPDLLSWSGHNRPSKWEISNQPYAWALLVLPLKIGEEIIGFWLFGRRDPDDYYSQVEIPMLQSLADQTAIALSNILQTERLKSVYGANINRYEQERSRLARDLHDSVLNEMAALLIGGDTGFLSPKFSQAYETMTEKLREIVNDLRPPMLAFGLKLAFEDFAENLMERNQDSVKIVANIQTESECRYPEVVENNVYRIVQQACENSLRHAHANRVMILGRLYPNKIDITVDDNGIGFDSDISLHLDDMLVNKHFGLVGMFERASLIGGELNINSKPNHGTQVQILWEFRELI